MLEFNLILFLSLLISLSGQDLSKPDGKTTDMSKRVQPNVLGAGQVWKWPLKKLRN
jgi:hypothetical protein